MEAHRRGPHVVICVTDDGVGLGHREQAGHGHGLRNTRERLESFYAGSASLELTGALPSGTRAEIRIPTVQVE